MPLIRNANNVRVKGGMLYFLHRTIHNSSAVNVLEHDIKLGLESVTTDILTVSISAMVYFVNCSRPSKIEDANGIFMRTTINVLRQTRYSTFLTFFSHIYKYKSYNLTFKKNIKIL